MKKLIQKRNIVFISLTFALTASTKSYSQIRCEAVFINSKSDFIDSQLETILTGESNRFTDLLIDQLENRPRLNSKQISTLTRNLERLTESYLKEANIAYTKSLHSTEIRNLLDKKSMVLYYDVYKLIGSPNGNSLSRQVYALNKLQEKGRIKSAVLFDPLYQYNHPSFSAHFTPLWRKNTTITLGPQIIKEYSEGLYRTFRHEIQHYLEFRKIAEGRMTLSRTTLEGKATDDLDPYSIYLSCDEAETYLRDLRFVKSRLNKLKESSPSASHEYEISELRQVELEIRNRLKDLVNRTLLAHHEVLKTLNTQKFEFVSKSAIQINLSEHKTYRSMRVDITNSNGNSPKEAIQHILLWNQERLLKIKNDEL